RDFGEFSNAILVGNFRSGWIAAFNGFTHKFNGFVKNPDDSLVFIDGLWSLTFGNDAGAGSANTLFFTAGINNETDGLFGTITPVDGLDGDEEYLPQFHKRRKSDTETAASPYSLPSSFLLV